MRGRGLKHLLRYNPQPGMRSPPMRGRGLKLRPYGLPRNCEDVAPHAGAWIETVIKPHLDSAVHVAPHAGAWIETRWHVPITVGTLVAPHAGAWIETLIILSLPFFFAGRPPCGGVD